jgi:hypothetical protein
MQRYPYDASLVSAGVSFFAFDAQGSHVDRRLSSVSIHMHREV